MRKEKKKQSVVINITLFTDLSKASQTDNIEDSVDYKVIKKKRSVCSEPVIIFSHRETG